MCKQDTLFADMAIYEYMAHEQLAITAWYVAKEFSDAFDVGMDAASKLAARFPDDKDKADNLAWFEKLREGGTPSSLGAASSSDAERLRKVDLLLAK